MIFKLITFGSHNNYIDAGKRLIEQAKNTEMFNEIILYTADDLKTDELFWKTHGDFVNKNSRGYGYWIWKSYLIKKSMEGMNHGDILLYLDCGCEIDCREKNWISRCIDQIKIDKIMGTYYRYPEDVSEKYWSKMDLVKNCNINDTLLNDKQRQAGLILFYVCDEVIQFVNEWYTLSSDYHNLDDSPSILENSAGFREHRHDQSIFSLLTKKYNLFSDIVLDMRCFKYYRNRSGKTCL
jgi:hypothetical protein